MNAPVARGAGAVMASRIEPADSLDFFPTPPWATRAFVVHALAHLGVSLADTIVYEPCAGEGHMSEVLNEYTAPMTVIASDLHDYGKPGIRYGLDFLNTAAIPLIRDPDWIITNPPFKPALAMTLLALRRAHVGVAMLLRSQWSEGGARYEQLFSETKPTLVAHYVERVPMVKHRWDPEASTATAYSWFVWIKGREPVAPFWIPPGNRKVLTRPDDVARFAPGSFVSSQMSLDLGGVP